MLRLGRYAWGVSVCELSACSMDVECVPLLQEAWCEVVELFSREARLKRVLPQGRPPRVGPRL